MDVTLVHSRCPILFFVFTQRKVLIPVNATAQDI